MRPLKRALVALSLIAAAVCSPLAGPVIGQETELESRLPEEVANEVRAVNRAIESARDALEREGRYVPATKGINVTLILSGGGDAMADLEEGNGVDPETFAGIYGGLALPEVAEHLTSDEEGRILYKNRIVRMYSISRLKALAEQRAKLEALPDF